MVEKAKVTVLCNQLIESERHDTKQLPINPTIKDNYFSGD